MTKVGVKSHPPSVAVGPLKKPTYEDLEAEIKRLRAKLDMTVRHNADIQKLAKDRGDRIDWLVRERRIKK